MFSRQVLGIRRRTWLSDCPVNPGDNRSRFTSGVLHSSQCDPHVRLPVCCVKYGSSDRFCAPQYDCTQRFARNVHKRPDRAPLASKPTPLSRSGGPLPYIFPRLLPTHDVFVRHLFGRAQFPESVQKWQLSVFRQKEGLGTPALACTIARFCLVPSIGSWLTSISTSRSALGLPWHLPANPVYITQYICWEYAQRALRGRPI
jgi:hypothetical protein